MDLERYVVAVDVGTRSARAGVFDAGGRALSRHVRPIALWEADGMRAEHASEDIWHSVCGAVRDAVTGANVPPEAIDALAFDATCSLVLRDDADAPLPLGSGGRDTIAWYDHRAVAEAEECTAGGSAVLDRLGGTMSPEMQVPKLMWLRRHRPDLWARLGLAMDLTDFLSWRATGRAARSACTLTAKWTWDPDTGWDRAFLASAGLEDLPRRAGVETVLPPGTVIDRLTAEAAAALGLPGTVRVATGLIDAFAGTLGVLGGLSEHERGGALALIAGTSTCVMSMSRQPWVARGIWGPYRDAILPGLHVNEGGQSATGALLDHVLRLHAPDRDASPRAHRRIAARIADGIAREGAAEFGRGLHVLPDFNGNRTPLADPLARGVVSGLTLDTGEDAVARLYWRAAVALALGLRQIVEHMETAGRHVARLMIAGGHARNELLMQLYADATGRAVHPAEAADAVPLGTAMLAAGIGLHDGPAAAARAMVAPGRRLAPDPARAVALGRDYRAFRLMQRHRDELNDLGAE